MENHEDLSVDSVAALRSIYDHLVRHEELFAVKAEQVFGNIALVPSVTNLPSIIQGLLAQGFLQKEADGLVLTLQGLIRINAVSIETPISFNFFRFVLLIALADRSWRLLEDRAEVPLIDPVALSLELKLYHSIDWVERAVDEFAASNLLTKNSVKTSDHVPATLVMPTFIGLYLARTRKRQLIDGSVKFNNKESEIEEISLRNSAARDFEKGLVDPNPQTKNPRDTNLTGETYSARDSLSPPVPAADRFVTRSDNIQLFEKAEQELETLIEAVRASNDLKVTADERLAIVSEVAGIRSLLKQPAVRVRAIYDAIRDNRVLKWLAAMAGAGIVGAKADAAINALLALLGL
jgi:hypothetical protein